MNSYFKDKIITSEIEFESSSNEITRVYPCILEIYFNKRILFYSKKPYIYKNPNYLKETIEEFNSLLQKNVDTLFI